MHQFFEDELRFLLSFRLQIMKIQPVFQCPAHVTVSDGMERNFTHTYIKTEYQKRKKANLKPRLHVAFTDEAQDEKKHFRKYQKRDKKVKKKKKSSYQVSYILNTLRKPLKSSEMTK